MTAKYFRAKGSRNRWHMLREPIRSGGLRGLCGAWELNPEKTNDPGPWHEGFCQACVKILNKSSALQAKFQKDNGADVEGHAV